MGNSSLCFQLRLRCNPCGRSVHKLLKLCKKKKISSLNKSETFKNLTVNISIEHNLSVSGWVGFLFLSRWGPGYLTMLLGYAKSRITVHNNDICFRNLLQFYHLKSSFPLLNILVKKWIWGTSLVVQQVRLKGRGFNPWSRN